MNGKWLQSRGEHWSKVDPGPTLDRPNPAGPDSVPTGIGSVVSPGIPGPALCELIFGPDSLGSVQPGPTRTIYIIYNISEIY